MARQFTLRNVFSTVSLVGIAVSLQAFPTVAQTPLKTGTLFEKVLVFDGKSQKLSPPNNVLVIENKIEIISAKSIQAPAGVMVTRIAGNGRTLMPGLIDAHTHLYLSVPQTVLFDPNTTTAILDAKAYDAAKATLMAGFTTVRDMAGPVFKLKNDIDQGKAVGPRIYPSGTLISQTSGMEITAHPNLYREALAVLYRSVKTSASVRSLMVEIRCSQQLALTLGTARHRLN